MQMGKTPSPADPRVVSLLASAVTLDRRAIEEAVEGFIALLDMSDPDPDLEDNADAEDGNDGEAGSWAEGAQGGHSYHDDDREQDEPETREAHRQYIRRERCRAEIRGAGTSWAFEVRYLRDESGLRICKGIRA